MVKGYCVNCRVIKDIEKLQIYFGFCPDCKTKMFRIGDLEAAKKKELTAGG